MRLTCEGGQDLQDVVPTDANIYSPKSWLDNALLQSEPRAAFGRLVEQGWTDAMRTLHPKEVNYTFWDYRRAVGSAMPACASTTCW